MKLIFGVVDVAYTHATGDDVTASAKTTGDVAEILEDKYDVMGTFFELRKDKIATILADSMGKALQDLIAGVGPQRPIVRRHSITYKTGGSQKQGGQKSTKSGTETHRSFTFEGDQAIEAEFRAFLTANEMAQLIGKVSPVAGGGGMFSGVVSGFAGAAGRGVSHRFLHRASVRAWTSDDEG